MINPQLVTLKVNGEARGNHRLVTLADVCHDLLLTGTHIACEHGICGMYSSS